MTTKSERYSAELVIAGLGRPNTHLFSVAAAHILAQEQALAAALEALEVEKLLRTGFKTRNNSSLQVTTDEAINKIKELQ